jgi:AcrR family transcriptional regulator
MPSTEKAAPTKAAPNRRGTLSRQRILRTALRIVEAEGLEALTMRRLASDLKVGPTAIYWHIPTRDDLLQGVLDISLERVKLELPSDGRWDDEVRRLCRTIRDEMSAHPYVFALAKRLPMKLGGPVTTTFLRLVERGGYDGRSAAEIVRMLLDYSVGMAYMKTLSSVSDELILDWVTSGAAQPADVASVLAYRELADRDAAFERGLDLLIGGLRVSHSDGDIAATP